MSESIKPGMAIAASGLWLAIAAIFIAAAADAVDGRQATAQIASAVPGLPTIKAGLQSNEELSRNPLRSQCGFGEGRYLKRLFSGPDLFDNECRLP